MAKEKQGDITLVVLLHVSSNNQTICSVTTLQDQPMTLKLSLRLKVVLVLIFLTGSVIGFMIKLPSAFRHSDKELHLAYYFLAAAFLNILFAKRNIAIHILIFAALYLFGIAIEHAQEYSNTLYHKKIHGRYDPEDVKSNLRGLITFSAIWLLYVLGATIYKRFSLKKSLPPPPPKEVPEGKERSSGGSYS
jgi:hypothetical protein